MTCYWQFKKIECGICVSHHIMFIYLFQTYHRHFVLHYDDEGEDIDVVDDEYNHTIYHSNWIWQTMNCEYFPFRHHRPPLHLPHSNVVVVVVVVRTIVMMGTVVVADISVAVLPWLVYIYIYIYIYIYTNTLYTVVVHKRHQHYWFTFLWKWILFHTTKRDVFAVEWNFSYSLYVFSLYSSSFANRSYIYKLEYDINGVFCIRLVLLCWCRFESWVIGELICYRIGTPLERSTGTHCTPHTDTRQPSNIVVLRYCITAVTSIYIQIRTEPQ